MWVALAQGRRGQGIVGLVILVEPFRASNLVNLPQDLDSNLVNLSQDLDSDLVDLGCGELVKLIGDLGLHLSQHLDETPLGFDDGAALSRLTLDPR